MKKHKMVMALLLTACLACLLMGCGPKRYKFKPEATSIYFTAEGTVEEALYDTLSEEYLSVDGLRTFVEGEIASYNEGLDSQPVSLTSFEGEEGEQIQVRLEYATIEDYEAFNYNDGQVQNAKIADISQIGEAGITLEGDFVKAEDQSSVELSEVQSLTKCYVLTGTADGDGDVTLFTEGNITYTTSNITEVDKNCAKVPAGEQFIIIYK